MPLTTADDVARVAALDAEPVLRNLLITHHYGALARAMRARTGGADINWCTLGTWASKTAGRFIRGDEVPAAFHRLVATAAVFDDSAAGLAEHGIGGPPVASAGLSGVAAGIVRDVSTFILEGNKVVFAELAGVFAAMLAELGDDERYDADRLRRFQERYREGDPEPDAATMVDGRMVCSTRGGQGLIRDMVAGYYAAMFETDEKTRAELLLLANARGGLHEQTRLQTYIAGSLNAPIEDTLLRHVHAHVDGTDAHPTAKSAGHALVDRVLPSIARSLEEAWHDFATLAMMELLLPDGSIHLGRPLPPAPGAPLVPAVLETIADPTLARVLAEYQALEVPVVHEHLTSLGSRFAALLGLGHPVPVDAIGVEAVDWVEFPQRMRLIFTLFRSRCRDERLSQEPFSAAQRDAILTSRVPDGPL